MFPLIPAGAGLGLLACLIFSIAAHSLRSFSRSRLAEICDKEENLPRFGEILRRHHTAFLANDTFALLALIGYLACATVWLEIVPGLPIDGTAAGGLASTAWATLVVVVGVLCRLILPWTIARSGGERFLYRGWPIIAVVEWLMAPLIWVVRRLDRLFHRMAGLPDPAFSGATVITEDLRSVIDEGQREGVIEAQAGSMINRVIELQNEDIGSVMTPRTDMVTLRVDATVEEARQRFTEAGHSRVPVIGESIDDVVGILYAKDLLTHLDGEASRSAGVRSLLREPFYVPVTNGVDTVLDTMRRERVHMAVVVDEYGGVAGLVTLEDVLEEIVGDIVDEYDPAQETGILQLTADVVEAEGWVHIDDLNEQFDLEMPEDGDYDTIGGFVFNQLARVPEIGEQFVWEGLRLTVTEADRRKVTKVRIEILEHAGAASEAAG